MRLPLRRRHAAHWRPTTSKFLFLALTSLSSAITFTPAPAANLDFSQLGRVALAGDFSGISLYQFEEQNERPFSTNGSEQLLARMPNGAFAPIVNTDATIQTMCTLEVDGKPLVVIGGNFTSIGAIHSGAMQSPAMALFNPENSEVTPLPGLSGQVNALLCDQERNMVYAGGSFVGANSTNAIAWVDQQWTNLPFAGFNGPVTSITKASNGNIVFGGSFTGLGNATAPSTPDGQVINLSTATISSDSSTSSAGFSDPKNIICKTGGADGAGNTWLLQDNTPGSWSAKFRFGFQPTKLRLYNTRQDGRGTRTWRFTALPINGIMNMTYIDPATGRNASCTNQCPLSNNSSIKFQDFHFVNVIGMNEFRIDISAFYGRGGGLNGIELFADDIFSYAVNDFNEPACAGGEFPSGATTTGPWTVSPSQSSSAEYLTARIAGPVTSSSASVVFTPDIRESGHYSVNLYTPGCLQDNTCLTRGQVKLTGQMTADPTKSEPLDLDLYQTNNFDKYDQIYFGPIDSSSGSFRPRVTMTPLAGQSLSEMTFVAQRVGFTLINSTGGLNGLYEFTPGKPINASDFMSSTFNKLGASFSRGSAVNALATSGDTTYIAGNFTSSSVRNIVAMKGNQPTVQSLDGGLNGEVKSMFLNETSLFVGGLFNGTTDNSVGGLGNVAVYDTSKNSWSPLGAGVNGRVLRVVGMAMNVTSSTPEIVVSVNGDFDQVLAFDNNPAVEVDGFAIWVPSQRNWLQNLDLPVEFVEGTLSTSLLNLDDALSLYAGSLASSVLGTTGAATLGQNVNRFPVNIRPSASSSSSSLSRRDGSLADDNRTGVVTGVFDKGSEPKKRNHTILGGHFTARLADGSTAENLVIIDGNDNDRVFGLGQGISSNSTFVALAVHGDVLFAGGKVTGTVSGAAVNGLITYNLVTKSFNTQPPALSNGTVSSIAPRGNTGDVYVGGSFKSAGSLGCPGVCYYSTSASQWNQVGQNLGGTVNSLMWATDSILLAGGDLAVNNTVSTFLAAYDTTKQAWDSYPGASQLPGPVSVLAMGTSDGKQIWAAGNSADGKVYLSKYDGESTWRSVGQPFEAETDIRGLQVFSLTSSHANSDLINSDEALMLTGSIVLPGFGTASAVLFDGKTFRPYALTNNPGNTAGTLSRIFVENNGFFKKSGGHLPLVFIVLIGLGISLALMLLIVVAGLFLDRLRKKREGYVPAPTSMYDRGSGIQRIPPHELLENLGKGRPGAPQV
ncbi:cortical protein marker for cell polarity-domain-containing protein [Podospora australis]|uniref:Cortical protein marker for cell polarity-domain-containing protein n=1 Tax=Podospora australis TaxID=1536484 RepID=A0AAN7AJ19_9PEZI|nr:cortical protein marker for cell polarity-domain-containing protein [Podospora australis]